VSEIRQCKIQFLFKKILSGRDLFGITDTHDPVTILVLVHTGDLATFPQELREGELAPRIRKSLREYIFDSSKKEPFFTI
jgi:hypothetical protein